MNNGRNTCIESLLAVVLPEVLVAAQVFSSIGVGYLRTDSHHDAREGRTIAMPTMREHISDLIRAHPGGLLGEAPSKAR